MKSLLYTLLLCTFIFSCKKIDTMSNTNNSRLENPTGNAGYCQRIETHNIKIYRSKVGENEWQYLLNKDTIEVVEQCSPVILNSLLEDSEQVIVDVDTTYTRHDNIIVNEKYYSKMSITYRWDL